MESAQRHLYSRKLLNYKEWYLVAVIVGYIAVSGIAIPFGVDNSRIFAVPYRILIALASFAIFCTEIPRIGKFKWSVFWVVLFWIVYIAKTYWSFHHDTYQLKILEKEEEVCWRILLIAVLPSIAIISLDYSKMSLKNIAHTMFYIVFGMLFINLIWGLFNWEGRNFPFIFSVYYISYGHFGTTLALIALFFLLNSTPKNKAEKILWYSGFILGFITIILAYARSPFLALYVVVPYILIHQKNKKYIAYFIAFSLLSYIFIYFAPSFGLEKIRILERLHLWLFEGDTSERMPLFKYSWDIFCANPLLGGRVLFPNGMYPHNIFLELLSATGFIGFVIYFAKFFPVFKNITKFIRIKSHSSSYSILFFALFLQYFVLIITSYNVYGVPEFLHLSALIIGISLYQTNEKT